MQGAAVNMSTALLTAVWTLVLVALSAGIGFVAGVLCALN